MENIEESLAEDEIVEEQKEAYKRLGIAYFVEIMRILRDSNNNERLSLLSELEALSRGETSRTVKRNPFNFNVSRAREIRLSKGFTLRGLSRELKVPVQSIFSYENGAYVPRTTYGKGGRRYLEWLKRGGYNPFSL